MFSAPAQPFVDLGPAQLQQPGPLDVGPGKLQQLGPLHFGQQQNLGPLDVGQVQQLGPLDVGSVKPFVHPQTFVQQLPVNNIFDTQLQPPSSVSEVSPFVNLGSGAGPL